MTNRLNVIAEPKKKLSSRAERRQETKEAFDRLWSRDPEQFDPNRSAMERERIERTWKIASSLPLVEMTALDLPCGWGALSKRLQKAGCYVHAADVADIPLNRLKDHIETFQECLPNTTLKEDYYDLVISTDAIAYLKQEDYRLYFSELARLVKPDGHVISSTPIDIDSEDALERFITIAETEFELNKWVFSYHAYHIRLCRFLKAPSAFIQRDPGKRSLWCRINSSFPLVYFWCPVKWLLAPLLDWIKQSKTLLIILEKACRFFSSESGISHVIILGHRRPLFTPPSPEEQPIERKHKREVWE